MSLASSLSALTKLPGLGEVESIISSRLGSDAPKITEISQYLLTLGGKRIRPVLTLLCGELFGIKPPFGADPRGCQLLDIAAGIELIHMATLLHDDIIDKSPVRRHKPSPYKLFGTDSTLLTGDFLLTRAFGLCARLDRFVIDRTEEACIALTEGEILETNLIEDSHSVTSSLLVAKKKTASLFRLAAESAAHLAGTTDAVVEQMALFGENLGIAFQILDDVLDVTSDEATLGKRSGQDLRERKPSLVNVLWLVSDEPLPKSSGFELSDGAKRLKTSPADYDPSSEDRWVSECLKFLPSSKTVDQARATAKDFVFKAQAALGKAADLHGQTVDKGALKALRSLTEFVLDRVL